MTPSDPENSSKNSGLHEDSRTAAPSREASGSAVCDGIRIARALALAEEWERLGASERRRAMTFPEEGDGYALGAQVCARVVRAYLVQPDPEIRQRLIAEQDAARDLVAEFRAAPQERA